MHAKKQVSKMPDQSTLVSTNSVPEDDTPIGTSGVLCHVLQKLRKYAPFDDVPLVFEGETGTGKGTLAQYLHSISPRAKRPFLVVDLGRLDPGTITSELFGHLRGSFTGAVSDARGLLVSAQGGTVFLDELQNASPDTQRRLLRVVDTGEILPVGGSRTVHVDLRLITATNIPISRLLSERGFLPDLAARLLFAPIRIPALRDHPKDIPLLVARFLGEFWARSGYAIEPRIHPSLMAALRQAIWPGNIRELSTTIHRLLIEAAPAPVIGLEHCEDDLAFLRTAKQGDVQLTRARNAELKQQLGTSTAVWESLGLNKTKYYRQLNACPRDEVPQER
jgi:DNA-binding NtrC family response regulator